MGFTEENPEKCTVPAYSEPYHSSSKHWTLKETNVYHSGQNEVQLTSISSLKAGESAAIVVDGKGDLHFFYKNKHESVVWSGLPKKPLWGFVDVYGETVSVKVDILHSECHSCITF